VLHVPVTVDGARFEAVLPLETLTLDDSLERELWDLYLVPAGGKPLRLGRHLDDMPGKKQIVTFPEQTVRRPARVAVRPYFTDADNISISCKRRNDSGGEKAK
jgi:hypothetical protein